jgi:hypothetical protein
VEGRYRWHADASGWNLALLRVLGRSGPAAQGMLGSPSDVHVAPDGSVYIADKGNLRIRRIGSVLPAFSLSTNVVQFRSEDGRQIPPNRSLRYPLSSPAPVARSVVTRLCSTHYLSSQRPMHSP